MVKQERSEIANENFLHYNLPTIKQVQAESFAHHYCQALKAPARYFMGYRDVLLPTASAVPCAAPVLASCSTAAPPRAVVNDQTRLHRHTPPSSSSAWIKPLDVRLLSSAGKINFPTPRMRAGACPLLSQKQEEYGEEEGEGEMGPETKMKRKEEEGWRENWRCCPWSLPLLFQAMPHHAPPSSSGFTVMTARSESKEDPNY